MSVPLAASFTIVLLAALILWIIDQTGCRHENLTGLANYFDDDLQCYVHLKQCDGCGTQVITWER